MRIIIAGGREFDNYELLEQKMDSLLVNVENPVIVSGGARGADSLGERYAKSRGYELEIYKAEWDKFGRGAGHIRNRKMAEVSNGLVCFWDGSSRGSKNMIDTAKLLDLKVRVVRY